MRTKNAKPIDALESAYLADVKRCACVICNEPGGFAHHPEQGLHFNTVAICYECHQGAHGWHGDKSRWRAAKMTEARAMNETRRRVDMLRSGITTLPVTRYRQKVKTKERSTYKPNPKIVKRPYAD